MSNVYYVKIDNNIEAEDVQKITKKLIDVVTEKENIKLEKKIPLKVHFGEKGNITYIKPENYLGIIEYLKERDIESCYIETNVIYGGDRAIRSTHLQVAEEHGFTQLPIVIADGEGGEYYAEVKINGKSYQSCKIGKAFLDYNQIIVLSHFKGHGSAGFGGAIKQLSMGFGSKGGKMAMHMGIKPYIVNRKCIKCKLCIPRCAEDAITIGKKSFIEHDKCVGCGGCVAICPKKAIGIYSLKAVIHFIGIGHNFLRNIAEYAYAAQLGKKNIYINFAMDITANCDCDPKEMKPIIDNFGIFVSTDPVAIDKVCWDMSTQRGKKFKGVKQFDYAEEIGLGSTKYNLIEIKM